jgi:serine/threonine protein kinase
VARRANPSREDPAALNERLGIASEIAQRVEHQNVVHCFGRLQTEDLTAQLLEALEGIDLARALRRSGPIATSLAVWIARQLAEGVAHAHSLGESHRGLNPEHVVVTRLGVVKVDFGLAAQHAALAKSALTSWIDLRYSEARWLSSDHPRLDAFGIAAILWEMITGRLFTEARDDAKAAYLATERAPGSLESLLAKALDPAAGIADARALADALTRVFYADLDGDDEQHGRQALAAWINSIAEPEASVFNVHRDRAHQDSLRTAIDGDSFEAMLAELDAPVRPKEFTRDDVDLGSERSSSSNGSWAPGMALRTRLEAIRSEQPTTAQKMTPQPIPAADARPTERAFASQPDGPLTQLKSKSVPDALRPPKGPSKVLWFWAGFAVTFSLLLLFSVWRSSADPPSDRKSGGREKPVEVPKSRS